MFTTIRYALKNPPSAQITGRRHFSIARREAAQSLVDYYFASTAFLGAWACVKEASLLTEGKNLYSVKTPVVFGAIILGGITGPFLPLVYLWHKSRS